MANKQIKINYFYPIVKIHDNREVLLDLVPLFQELKDIPSEERIMDYGPDENIQLKKIEYDSLSSRWRLSFLRNRSDAPFITKLDDKTEIAEKLEENEFVGQECCLIYDEVSKIIALQSNRSSISISGLALFFNKYLKYPVFFSAIIYKDEYCDISLDDGIEYKGIILSYTNINELRNIAEMEDDEATKFLAKIANDLSAINGKIEMSVGRSKTFLQKLNLRKLATIFKNNRNITNSLKVKMVDGDDIRLIDLLNNKATDEIEIAISKDDPKTFDKILNAMDAVLDVALCEKFDKCKEFVAV